jgi:hypothetical protein
MMPVLLEMQVLQRTEPTKSRWTDSVVRAAWTLVAAQFFSFTLELGAPKTALAYPVLVPVRQIPWMVGTKRENLIAMAYKDDQWKRIPLQLEEIEEDIAIVFRNPTESWPVRKKLHKPKTADPFEGYLDLYHRAIVDDEDAGECNSECESTLNAGAQKLCAGNKYRNYSRKARIDLDYTKRTAFIVDCMSKQIDPFKTTSTHDKDNFTFKGETFDFHYKGKSSVMLDQFRVGTDRKPVLTNTEMHVFLSPKFMFNIHFEDDDVTAEISSVTYGPISLSVEIATSLSVFIFQINKQICCDINVFKDSLYFPIMLELPYNGDSFTKGSGLFFGYHLPEDTRYEFFPVTEAKDNRPARGATAVVLEREGKLVTIGFGNLKSIDGKDLAPREENRNDLKKIGFPSVSSHSGIFYDATQLPDGFNHFDVWFFVGNENDRPKLLDYARHGVSFTARRVW